MTYYLTHLLSTTDGKGCTLTQKIFEFILKTVVHEKLTIIGTDGMSLMTDKFNNALYFQEEQLKSPLQSSICLLHTNKLPFQHVFMALDFPINSSDNFSRPIG